MNRHVTTVRWWCSKTMPADRRQMFGYLVKNKTSHVAIYISESPGDYITVNKDGETGYLHLNLD